MKNLDELIKIQKILINRAKKNPFIGPKVENKEKTKAVYRDTSPKFIKI